MRRDSQTNKQAFNSFVNVKNVRDESRIRLRQVDCSQLPGTRTSDGERSVTEWSLPVRGRYMELPTDSWSHSWTSIDAWM